MPGLRLAPLLSALLAAAASAVAFAVVRTEGRVLQWSMAPLGLAVFGWAASFLWGCRHIAYVSATLHANAGLLTVQSGNHPQVGHHPQLMQVAVDGIREAAENNSNKAGTAGRRQFRSFILGCGMFLVWRILEMAS